VANRRQDVSVVGGASDRQALSARVGLYLAVAYITLTTSDVDIARVPLKLFVVAFALIGWLWVRRPWIRPREPYAFAAPVLAGGILIPLVWFALALLLHHRHDPAQPANTSYAVQQASRFVYLLLYFPILDEVRRCASIAKAGPDRLLRIHRVWLWPTLLLCGITLLFFLGHALLGLDYSGGNVGPFQGEIALEPTGTFRVYLIDDVMLIPAMALLLGSARRGRLGNLGLGITFALLSTAYLSHTRGIWLGMIVAAAVMLLLSSVRLPLSRRARGVAGLLACVALVAFVVNADPSVSHRAVSLVTSQNELSTSYRLEQGPQLLRGFRRHVALGSGLGATLPSGFRRNQSEPWSFELSYLQLLFQLGVIGILILLLAPAWALYRGVRSLACVDRDHRIAIAAAVGGIAGFLFTSGGNPYLMTSVGMLALAVLLAMVEQAMAITPVLPDTVGLTFSTPQMLQKVPVLDKLAHVRPRRPAAIFCIVALIGVLSVAEFGRSRRAARSTGVQGVASTEKAASIASATRHMFRLPSNYLRDPSAQLVSDDAPASDSALWSLTFAKGALFASRWRLSAGRILTDPSVPAGPRPPGRVLGLGVVSLGVTHPDVLGIMTNLNSRIHVELRDLTHAGRTLVAGTTPALPLASHEHRDVGLSGWAGTTPDLIVVDRSATAPVMRVQVFSAESDFHDELLDVVVPKGPFSVADFSLLIGPVNSPTADLMLVSRGSTSSSHTEVHVLLGPQAFQTFGEQSPVNLPAVSSLTTMFLLGREDGLAVLYAVDRAAGVLNVVQLG
jgi:O-Antigen ligase